MKGFDESTRTKSNETVVLGATRLDLKQTRAGRGSKPSAGDIHSSALGCLSASYDRELKGNPMYCNYDTASDSR